MLEASYGINFFLKRPKSQSDFRYVYIRITVDGIPKEVSTKRKWYVSKWNQRSERATCSKDDAKSINFFLDSICRKIEDHRIKLINRNITITSQNLIDFILGNSEENTKVLEEFQKHNDEILVLASKGEYSKRIAKSFSSISGNPPFSIFCKITALNITENYSPIFEVNFPNILVNMVTIFDSFFMLDYSVILITSLVRKFR